MQLVSSLLVLCAGAAQTGSVFLSPPIEWLQDARLSWKTPPGARIILDPTGHTIPNRYVTFRFISYGKGPASKHEYPGQLNFWSRSRLVDLGLLKDRKSLDHRPKRPRIVEHDLPGRIACMLYGNHNYYVYAYVVTSDNSVSLLAQKWFRTFRVHNKASAVADPNTTLRPSGSLVGYSEHQHIAVDFTLCTSSRIGQENWRDSCTLDRLSATK